MTDTQRAILKSLLLIQRAQDRKGRRAIISSKAVDCYDWRSTRGLSVRGYIEPIGNSGEWRVTPAGIAALS